MFSEWKKKILDARMNKVINIPWQQFRLLYWEIRPELDAGYQNTEVTKHDQGGQLYVPFAFENYVW